jgi:phosphoribosylamine--glycine ligase
VSLDVPRRILILGSGGREHALAWKLAAEAGVEQVVVAPGSAGIAQTPGVRCVSVDPLNGAAVVALAHVESIELVVIGPEAPLAAGVADALEAGDVPVFGPDATAARLESSKTFCHQIAEAAGVRMARAQAFAGGAESVAAAEGFANDLAAAGLGIVLKADGLAAGKGVVVTTGLEEALTLLPSFLTDRPTDRPALVVEARLDGAEASVIAICDGLHAVALPAARDHKRLGDGDAGPNTGGMGAYSPLPDLSDADVAHVLTTVHRPILAEMNRRGMPFRGFLYAGLMLTADGPALLETNVRLGDPEAQAILPLLGVDLAPLLLAAARGALPATPELLPTHDGAAVAIVLAAAGYPGDPRKGDAISGIDAALAQGALVFHAGTAATPDGAYSANGGRVLAVVGRGPDIAAARDTAERAADVVSWPGMQRRHDIARGVTAAAGSAGAVS